MRSIRLNRTETTAAQGSGTPRAVRRSGKALLARSACDHIIVIKVSALIGTQMRARRYIDIILKGHLQG
jgi:hypothetical protein